MILECLFHISHLFCQLGFLGIHHTKPQTTVDAPNVANVPLTKNSGMQAIVSRLRLPDSGLEVKDRVWLKLQIPNAFLGSELVQWLCTNVEGFEVSYRSLFTKFCKHLQNLILH